MGQILLFANPIAGSGGGAAAAQALAEYLPHQGYQVATFLSRAQAMNYRLGEQEVEAAIIIGGDGTLRGVVQWAIDQAMADPTQAILGRQETCLPFPLLVVPSGTANLMGQHLNLKWDRRRLGPAVTAALRQRHLAYLDVATTPAGIFLLMAGVGFDGWIVHELDRLRRGPINLGSYFLPAVKALTDFDFPPLRVMVDGQCVFDHGRAIAIVANVPEYGIGFAIVPQANPADRLLDICIMPCTSRAELCQLFLAAATGGLANREGVICRRGKHVEIHSPAPVTTQMDGEPAGFTPLTVDLLPGRIGFIVPRPI